MSRVADLLRLCRRADLQRQTGTWADGQFPNSNNETIRSHLKEEMLEFLGEDAEGALIPGVIGDPEEAADILLLLMHHAHKNGYDLLDEGIRKLAINQKRKWKTTPEPGGHIKHV